MHEPTRMLLVGIVLAACAGGSSSSTTAATTTTTATTVPPSTTLQAVDVYARVSPSLAFVETPLGSGSAVLVDDGLAVTNAHVVWPDDEVTVSFPGGPSGSVPVIGYDWMADLALLDLSSLEGLPAPLPFERSTPEPGTSVYLVGYPADDAATASPAITAGIVSRTRTWPEADVTLIQSDALISGGQSGGALVDDAGRMVGISGLSVGEGFALALSSEDVARRIDDVLTGADPHALGDRSAGGLTGAPTAESSIPATIDETVFVFNGQAGEAVSVEILASDLVNADIIGPDGFVETSSESPDTVLVLQADLVLDGVYFVVVYPEVGPVDTVTVSGVDTRMWNDPDHGVPLTIGVPTAGNGDYPGDLDWFVLDLVAGQTVTITASSINIDPSLLIDVLPDGDPAVFTRDSDSGGGVIGFDATVEFTAPNTGAYAVAVFDETGFGPGGYIVTVEEG